MSRLLDYDLGYVSQDHHERWSPCYTVSFIKNTVSFASKKIYQNGTKKWEVHKKLSEEKRKKAEKNFEQNGWNKQSYQLILEQLREKERVVREKKQRGGNQEQSHPLFSAPVKSSSDTNSELVELMKAQNESLKSFQEEMKARALAQAKAQTMLLEAQAAQTQSIKVLTDLVTLQSKIKQRE
jgi:hypothetical protein